MMMKIVKKYMFLSVVLSLLSVSAWAAPADPVAMLKNLSDQTISKLKANQAEIKKNPQATYNLIQTILMPHVDLMGMSRSVVGKKYWDEAAPAQQKEFSEQFSSLIAGTYVSALQSYTNQQIKFYPVRGGLQPEQTRVEINSVILQPNGPSIPVNYRLILKNNEWVMYDLIVDSVSLLNSYRAQFATPLQEGGLPTLIEQLKQHNKKAL